MTPAAGQPPPPGRPCYLLPLRWHQDRGAAELTAYLRRIAATCEVVIVDGSPERLFGSHHRAWGTFTRHLRPDPGLAYRNGKVNGVITGIRAAGSDQVIIADDDVRYDGRALAQILALLHDADLVIPQNYFSPLPWHALWDTARTLINRAFGMDYPGTVALRRAAFLHTGCYNGDVLFENLELLRTMRAGGARVTHAPHLYIRRLPPNTRQFAGQRIRQAYDSLGQPPRLAAELTLLPAAIFAAATRRYATLGCAAAAAITAAEYGRRRHGGTAAFPPLAPLLAPAWIAERSICAWLALACRLRGGITYAGQRLPRAATPTTVLRRHTPALDTARSPEPSPRMRPITKRLNR